MVDGIWSLQYMAAGPLCASAGPLAQFQASSAATGGLQQAQQAEQPVFTHAVLFRYANEASLERFEQQPRVQLMLGGTGAPAGTGEHCSRWSRHCPLVLPMLLPLLPALLPLRLRACWGGVPCLSCSFPHPAVVPIESDTPTRPHCTALRCPVLLGLQASPPSTSVAACPTSSKPSLGGARSGGRAWSWCWQQPCRWGAVMGWGEWVFHSVQRGSSISW